jgi:hypothetical protein
MENAAAAGARRGPRAAAPGTLGVRVGSRAVFAPAAPAADAARRWQLAPHQHMRKGGRGASEAESSRVQGRPKQEDEAGRPGTRAPPSAAAAPLPLRRRHISLPRGATPTRRPRCSASPSLPAAQGRLGAGDGLEEARRAGLGGWSCRLPTVLVRVGDCGRRRVAARLGGERDGEKILPQ